MPTVSPFYSVKEAKKPAAMRECHNNSECPTGRNISDTERRSGTGGYQVCPDCSGLNAMGR